MTSRRGFLGALGVAPAVARLPAPAYPPSPTAAAPAQVELIALAMGLIGVLDPMREIPARDDVTFVAKFIRPGDSPYHLARRIAPYYLTSGQIPSWLR